jgi:hypothetical protein
LFDEQGVAYDVRPEAILVDTSRACYQGLMYEVAADQAEQCRKLLEKIGMTKGIVPASDRRQPAGGSAGS